MLCPSVINHKQLSSITSAKRRNRNVSHSGKQIDLQQRSTLTTNNSRVLIHVTKSKNNIRLASLANTTKQTTAYIRDRTTEKSASKSESKSKLSTNNNNNNNKLSLSSYYSKIMSSLMLDLGGKIQQLTNNLQKNHHKRITDSRLSLISDECYLSTGKLTTATPPFATASGIQNQSSLDQQRQNNISTIATTTMTNKSIIMCPNATKKLFEHKDDNDGQATNSASNYNHKPGIDYKMTTIYNDCQPLLKIAPKYKIQQQSDITTDNNNSINQQFTADDGDDVFQLTELKLKNNEKSRSCCVSNRVKYSLESLEYQRHLDNVQNSFISRNLVNSISLCQTMLWVVIIHMIIMGSSCLVRGDLSMGHNQLLVYSPLDPSSSNAVQPSSLSIGSTANQQVSVSPQATDDYADDGADLDIMAGQQQIPTAHLLSAAGHIVPDNYFGPNSVPMDHFASTHNGQHQHQHQTAVSTVDSLQTASSERDIITVDGAHHHHHHQQQQHQQQPMGQQENVASYIDYNGYNLATQPQHDSINQADVVEFNGGQPSQAAYYAIYNGENPMPQSLQISLQNQNHLSGQDQMGSASHYSQMLSDNQIFSQSLDGGEQVGLPVVSNAQMSASNNYNSKESGLPSSTSNTVYNSDNNGRQKASSHQSNFGQPTRDGTSPKDLLSPNQAIPTNTISSPAINALANMPKVNMQQLASKIPQMPTPQFSFSSSKDPVEKVKVVNQKKRTMMRQAEQLAKLMLDSFNKKFGTTIGDQTDIPFVLSTLGPLGFAQNLLFDPSFLITLLHSTEKGYISDVLPTPAKMIIRPVLNAFRMPNKKRDKGNLINVLSYISSGLQSSSTGLQPNHRQGGSKKSGTKKY